jgi:hypothetical protein
MRCPNCATEIRVPQIIGSSDSASGQSSTILNSEGLSEASAINNSTAAETTSGTETELTSSTTPLDVPKSTNVPRKSSFDVDDLQLDSLAISDLEDRHRDSLEIREEKESKRRLQLAAEKENLPKATTTTYCQ